jgi:hypothetical protein
MTSRGSPHQRPCNPLKSARPAAFRFHKAGNGASQQHERKLDMAKQITTHRVAYAITRTEFYDIDARNEKDAEDRAFEDGILAEEGETTNVVFCGVERRTVLVGRTREGDR